MSKPMKNKTAFGRGASFVLNKGTKVVQDKRKKANKNACRKKDW